MCDYVYSLAEGNPAIAQMDVSDVQKVFAGAIEYIEALHGISVPSLQYAILVKVLTSMALDSYGFLNQDEIRKAFEYNVIGNHWEPIPNYNKLDAAFFFAVLEKYKYFRYEQIKSRSEKKSQLMLPQSKAVDKNLFISECRELYASGVRIFPVVMLYEYMVNAGMFKEDSWAPFYQKAKSKLNAQAIKGEWFPKSIGELVSNTSLRDKIKSDDSVYEVVCLAKQMAIFEQFDKNVDA